jgi:hypothetical protein
MVPPMENASTGPGGLDCGQLALLAPVETEAQKVPGSY